MKHYFFLGLFFGSLIFTPQKVNAQQYESVYGDPIHDVTIVGACALGGAVLGLSTLSFTEEPGDHLKNILVGGAIGLIAGVAAVAYFQSRAPSSLESYSSSSSQTLDHSGLRPIREMKVSGFHTPSRPVIPSVTLSFPF